MNEVIKNIMTRKGATEYSAKMVDDETLETIVKAGIAAPNAFNRQAWDFAIVSNPEILKEIAELTAKAYGCEPGDTLYNAPVVIIVSSAKDNYFRKQDCSAAHENMALAAKSLGVASRFLDIPNLAFQSEKGAELYKKCGIPEGYETVCFLCLGYSEQLDAGPNTKDFTKFHFVK